MLPLENPHSRFPSKEVKIYLHCTSSIFPSFKQLSPMEYQEHKISLVCESSIPMNLMNRTDVTNFSAHGYYQEIKLCIYSGFGSERRRQPPQHHNCVPVRLCNPEHLICFTLWRNTLNSRGRHAPLSPLESRSSDAFWGLPECAPLA